VWIVRGCYEWRINNLNVGSWAGKLKLELDKLGVTYVSQGQQNNDIIRMCRIIN
jgi:hypothetical protein